MQHSCRRLSLTSLAYLWQRDQAELLDEMIDAGTEAVLIKVAGIGLQPKHLGQTLAEMRPTLTTLVGVRGTLEAGLLICILRISVLALTSAERAASTRA
jgi:diphthine-ammonia ligase